jgi:hypothetical protein
MSNEQEANYAAIPKDRVPPELHQYMAGVVGGVYQEQPRTRSQHRGRRVIAGWEWDGTSREVLLVLSPRGNALLDIPIHVWRRVQQYIPPEKVT